MKPQPRDASSAGPTVPHVERATSVVTGQPILIRCECPLGRDHTYAEWQERFGGGTTE
ncbi:hypothetical protein ACFRFH_08150 [Leifsonia sp. NPDC056824]|uniref:hypothetical protein n=1 Tax=Leifsonia sp. NPDC056824 TaxID=3345953 RepID=UPI0036B96DFD